MKMVFNKWGVKFVFFLVIILIGVSAVADDTWVGSDTTGNAYRMGNVGIGRTPGSSVSLYIYNDALDSDTYNYSIHSYIKKNRWGI